MTGGVLAILGLAGGVALAFAGAQALTPGARALPVAAAGLVGAASAAWPAFAFAVGASAANLPGAAVGAVTGGLIATAFLTAVIGACASETPAKGVRAFAVAAAASVAVLIGVAYDGQISLSEGGMMLLGAVAVGWQMVQAKSLFRPAEAAGADAAVPPKPLLASGWTVLGLAVIALATWLLTEAVAAAVARPPRRRSEARPDRAGPRRRPAGSDPDRRRRKTRGGRTGPGEDHGGDRARPARRPGRRGLVRPIYVSDAFLGAPTVAVAAGAMILLLIAFTGVKPPRSAIVLGAVVYLGFLAAFLGAFG